MALSVIAFNFFTWNLQFLLLAWPWVTATESKTNINQTKVKKISTNILSALLSICSIFYQRGTSHSVATSYRGLTIRLCFCFCFICFIFLGFRVPMGEGWVKGVYLSHTIWSHVFPLILYITGSLMVKSLEWLAKWTRFDYRTGWDID